MLGRCGPQFNLALAATLGLWVLGVPLTAMAQSVEGRWRLIGNPYESRIEIGINERGIWADVGCMATSFGVDVHAKVLEPSGDALVIEAPCHWDEGRDAWHYWQRVLGRITAVNSLELKGQRLLLRSKDGHRLWFARIRS